MDLAIISGTSIKRSGVFADWSTERVETAYGRVDFKRRGRLIALNRHGFENPLPPHAINHRANVAAIDELGLRSALTFSSVGSLDRQLEPGTFVSIADYMSFDPKTFIDDRMSVFAPRLDNTLLDDVEAALEDELTVARGKIYAQTRGPRFETRAETRALRRAWGADVVGMTFASEADLLLERGLSVTAFCMVDNFAHGVSEQPLSEREFMLRVADNQAKVDRFLGAIVRRFGEEPEIR